MMATDQTDLLARKLAIHLGRSIHVRKVQDNDSLYIEQRCVTCNNVISTSMSAQAVNQCSQITNLEWFYNQVNKAYESHDCSKPWSLEDADYDLSAAIGHNNVTLSAPIMEILATITGERDGDSWHWIVMLESGDFAYISGGCDYTGWDCQSNCEAYEAGSLLEVLRLIPEAYRSELRDQLPDSGKA